MDAKKTGKPTPKIVENPDAEMEPYAFPDGRYFAEIEPYAFPRK